MSNPPAGWYPDPTGQPDTIRWWNGKQWTNRTEKGTVPDEGQPAAPETGGDGSGDDVQPAWGSTASVDPTPVEPTSVQPTSVRPTPAQATSVQQTGSEQRWGATSSGADRTPAWGATTPQAGWDSTSPPQQGGWWPNPDAAAGESGPRLTAVGPAAIGPVDGGEDAGEVRGEDGLTPFERARATWNAPEIAPAPPEHWTQQPVPDVVESAPEGAVTPESSEQAAPNGWKLRLADATGEAGTPDEVPAPDTAGAGAANSASTASGPGAADAAGTASGTGVASGAGAVSGASTASGPGTPNTTGAADVAGTPNSPGTADAQAGTGSWGDDAGGDWGVESGSDVAAGVSAAGDWGSEDGGASAGGWSAEPATGSQSGAAGWGVEAGHDAQQAGTPETTAGDGGEVEPAPEVAGGGEPGWSDVSWTEVPNPARQPRDPSADEGQAERGDGPDSETTQVQPAQVQATQASGDESTPDAPTWGAQPSGDSAQPAWGSQPDPAPAATQAQSGWGVDPELGQAPTQQNWGVAAAATGGQSAGWGAKTPDGQEQPAAWGGAASDGKQQTPDQGSKAPDNHEQGPSWGAAAPDGQEQGPSWGAKAPDGQQTGAGSWGSQQAAGGVQGAGAGQGEQSAAAAWGAGQSDGGPWADQHETGWGTKPDQADAQAAGGPWGEQKQASWGSAQGGAPTTPTEGGPWGGGQQAGGWGSGPSADGAGVATKPAGATKKPSGGGGGPSGAKLPLLIGGGVALILLIVTAVFMITNSGDKKADPTPAPPTNQPTIPPGGVKPGQSKNPKLHEGERIASTAISFPRRTGTWSDRKRLVPQLLDSSGQYLVLQEKFDGTNNWYADIFVGALGNQSRYGGDPKATALALANEVPASMYGNIQITRKAGANGEVKRSGKSGWFVQQTVTAKSSKVTARVLTLTVAVFDLGDGTAVAYISDVPTNRPDLKAAESQAYKGINVG
ncbi:hypothetical protein E1263_41675 [Kribbella antibiotica]|uniref:DUF2510 domain-containing protein n=1 Tax=Kribbella antibiotica TaxID=190195 RepID=A0A4R4YF96_9ACTN|nr:hypothetical protein [Kribbella antibiotica]TDD43415.1 hypothetical protein E1263_41675 [Kribbella antibiotica]